MRTIDEIRRSNLKILLKQQFSDSPSQVASRMGMQISQVSQLFSGHRNIGKSIARRLETVCGLPAGWMDQDHDRDAFEVEALELLRSFTTEQEREKALKMLRLLRFG